VGGGGQAALADFDEPVNLRTTEKMKALVEPMLRAVELLKSTSPQERAAARRVIKDAKPELERAGVHARECQLWLNEYLDYDNVSISPPHVLKGTYHDTIQWTLRAVYNACESEAQWRAWVRHCDRSNHTVALTRD
jgi:hypothetical protein